MPSMQVYVLQEYPCRNNGLVLGVFPSVNLAEESLKDFKWTRVPGWGPINTVSFTSEDKYGDRLIITQHTLEY